MTMVEIKIQPKAKKEGFELMEDGCLKLKVRAPAEDGKANARVVELLSKALRIASSKIVLVRGASSRKKAFQIETNLSENDLRAKLLEEAES